MSGRQRGTSAGRQRDRSTRRRGRAAHHARSSGRRTPHSRRDAAARAQRRPASGQPRVSALQRATRSRRHMSGRRDGRPRRAAWAISGASTSKSLRSSGGLEPKPGRFGITRLQRSASGRWWRHVRAAPTMPPGTSSTVGPDPSRSTSRSEAVSGACSMHEPSPIAGHTSGRCAHEQAAPVPHQSARPRSSDRIRPADASKSTIARRR